MPVVLDEEFLDPALDPSTLTVAKLKNALGQAGVELPMKQEKKAFYVDLFRRHISEKLSDLQKKKTAVVPSAAGILAVSSNGSPRAQETADLQNVYRDNSPSTRRKRLPTNDTPSKSLDNPFQSGASDTESPVVRRRARSRTRRLSRSARDVPKEKSASGTNTALYQRFINTSTLPVAGYVDATQVLSQHRKPRHSNIGILFLQILLGALTIATALVSIHLQQWRSLQYCTEGQGANDTAMYFAIPYPLPRCRPCPAHAQCVGSALVRCGPGYIKVSPSFPFHEYCAPDLVKYANAEKLIDEASELLRQQAGAVECGEKIGDIFLTEPELKKALRLNHVAWEDDRFDDYWSLAVKDIDKYSASKEIEVRIRGERRLFYSSNPHHPFACRMAKFVEHVYETYKIAMLIVSLCFMLISIAIWKYQAWRAKRNRVLDLVEGVVAVLVQQDERYRHGQEERSALSISQLRDFFLPDIKSLVARSQFWDLVRVELLHNSSIRETAILIEGEQHDAWQWIGSSTLLTPDKRRSRPEDLSASRTRLASPVPERMKLINQPDESIYPSL